MDSELCLVVKAPHQLCPDYSIERCSEEWSVLDIKKHLSSVYPGNPKVESQRIIYSGRLLQDNLKVKEFIRKNPESTTHTVHLVCSMLPNQTFEQKPQLAASTPRNLEIPSVPAQLNINSTSAATQQILAGANVAQQLALYHQLYAQYLAQYSNFVFPAQIASTVAPAPVIATPEQQPAAPVENNVNNNDEQRPAENIRLNAAGALEDNDEEMVGRQDWLDWIYVIIRALMLFIILYFYSSFGRLLIVAGTSVLLYLYQNRWFVTQARPANQEQPNENEDLPNNVNDDNGNEVNPQPQEQAESADQSNEDQPEDEVDAPVNLPNEPNFASKVWLCLYNFLISLIPEPPAVQN